MLTYMLNLPPPVSLFWGYYYYYTKHTHGTPPLYPIAIHALNHVKKI